MSTNESTTSRRLLLVPLEDLVVFPNMNVTLTVDVGDEETVLLVPKWEDEYAKVGTVAEVTDRIRLPGGGRAVALSGLHRGIAGAAVTDPRGRLFVEVEEHPDPEDADGRIRELEREYRAVVEEILELRGDDGRIAAFVRSITEPGALADTSGYSPDLTFEQKVRLLETIDATGSGGIGWAAQAVAMDSDGALHVSYTDVVDGDLRYATNASGSTGFPTCASNPARSARSRSRSLAWPVSATTGIDLVFASPRICLNASMPFIPGSWMSMSTRSGFFSLASFTPSSPVTASRVL